MAKKARDLGLRQKVIAYLEKNGETDIATLCEGVGRDTYGMHGVISNMTQDGQIRRVERGWYGPATNGKGPVKTASFKKRLDKDAKIAEAAGLLFSKNVDIIDLLRWAEMTKEMM